MQPGVLSLTDGSFADAELLSGCVCREAGGRQRSAVHRDLFRSGLFMSGDVMDLSGFDMAAGLGFWAMFQLLLFPGPGHKAHTSPSMRT